MEYFHKINLGSNMGGFLNEDKYWIRDSKVKLKTASKWKRKWQMFLDYSVGWCTHLILHFKRMVRAQLTSCPRTVKNSQKRPVKKDINWSYRVSKHLGTFLLILL